MPDMLICTKKKKKSLLLSCQTSGELFNPWVFSLLCGGRNLDQWGWEVVWRAPSTGWGWIWNAWRLAPDPSLLLHPRILSASFFTPAGHIWFQSSLLETTWKKAICESVTCFSICFNSKRKKQLFASYNFFFIEYAVSLVEGIFLLNKKEKKEKKKQHWIHKKTFLMNIIEPVLSIHVWYSGVLILYSLRSNKMRRCLSSFKQQKKNPLSSQNIFLVMLDKWKNQQVFECSLYVY